MAKDVVVVITLLRGRSGVGDGTTRRGGGPKHAEPGLRDRVESRPEVLSLLDYDLTRQAVTQVIEIPLSIGGDDVS